MKLSKLTIKNFRGVSEVNLDLDKNISIIVGPNAVGKTTILEAIRLIKAALTPRYFQETEQTLSALGAMSPQPQLRGGYFDFSAIARDPSKPISLTAKIDLSDSEIESLDSYIDELSMEILKGQMGRADDQGQLALTQFLSSDKGKESLGHISNDVQKRIVELKRLKSLDLSLTVTPGQLSGQDQFSQVVCSALERRLPPTQALMSYFPADRAFPQGEVNVQIGPGEASAQIQSHIGQPQTKFQRLKQSIVNSILLNNVDQSRVKSNFEMVFKELLPGKSLEGLSVTSMGTLKVSIREEATGKVFDVDSMSSGEKGLILTFLIVSQTMAKGGVALLDEPELHLNPAVCKKLLPFMIEKISEPNELQFIICTHSGEMLGVAFEREDCAVYHLRAHNNATKIYERDHHELFEALRRLGTSTADALFSNGNIYVEGEHDVSILEEGFYDQIAGCKVASLGGRSEVEKEIRSLQKAEGAKSLEKVQCFIFDNDNKPTNLESTEYVRVSQWDRYCLENYLIEKKILFDLIKENSSNPPGNRGEFDNDIKEMACAQKTQYVAKLVYLQNEYESPGIRAKEIRDKSYEEIASILVARLSEISGQVKDIESDKWVNEFVEACNLKDAEISPDWDVNWEKKCSGKELIDSLYKKYSVRLPKLDFKKKVINQMRIERSENWRLIGSILSELLAGRT